jgi:hypothetical protein
MQRIDFLNTKRQKIQAEIGLMSQKNSACYDCRGKCCRGQYDHFIAIDFFIRKFSKNCIKNYSCISDDCEHLHNYPSLKKHANFLLGFFSPVKIVITHSGKCPNLIDYSCVLQYADRPIHCVLFTCDQFRKKLENEDLKKLAQLSKELERTEYEVFSIYVPRKYMEFYLDYFFCI